ncbi:MAG: cytochrome c3 family protein [Coriobacteriales bacterium]|nr:cytochrome c3 family protein [Coriobacteriales bacterium]
MDCSSCHTAEVQSESDTTTAYFHHAGQQGVRCGTCHVDNDGALMKAHEDYGTAKVPVKLKKTEVSSEVCLDCHNAGALKTETESTTILTDSKGTVVNPHDLPVNDDHARNVTCSSCHKMHGSDPVIETAPKACLTCHHEDVYECGTCHRV